MGVINRGIKNAFRNAIRTISVTFILALSIAMALIMLLALKTVQSKIDTVKSSIGNMITVSPAGVRGFEGGGELLNETDINSINSLPHVVKVIKTINDRLTTDKNTTLKSSIEPGSFGTRQQQQIGPDNVSREGQNFTMPIMVTGTNDSTVTLNLNVSKFDIISGSSIDASSDENIALAGTDLATKNDLSVDSIFKVYEQDIKVAGIFDGGNKFANSTLVIPLKTLQKLSDQTDQINSVMVQTDSIDAVVSVQNSIKEKLGDKADVISQQDTSNEAVKPLENIKTISFYSLIGSLVAGSVIIFLIMVMIVRERRKEIGVLKAIGSSNVKIVAQFAVESLVLALLSSVIGMILASFFSNPALDILVSNSQDSSSPGAIERGGGFMMRFAISGVQNNLRDIHTVVGYEIILYGLLAAVIIAIIGSSIPSFLIAKVRPAEIMRNE